MQPTPALTATGGDVADGAGDEDEGACGVDVAAIHLHAWRYVVDGTTYEVGWPEWAGGAAGLQDWLQRSDGVTPHAVVEQGDSAAKQEVEERSDVTGIF